MENVWLFLDHVIIYTLSIENHLEPVRKLLNSSQRHKLFGKGSKCKVVQREVYFFGQYVSAENICMDDSLMMKGIEEWPAPSSINDVQNLLEQSVYC